MQQQTLLSDDGKTIFDVLTTSVQAAGGPKRVAAKLWPALGSASAEARLRCCLNPDHAQKPCPTELLMIGKLAREAGDNSLMEYLGRELANEVKPITLKAAKKRAELDRLEAMFADGLKAIAKMREVGE